MIESSHIWGDRGGWYKMASIPYKSMPFYPPPSFSNTPRTKAGSLSSPTLSFFYTDNPLTGIRRYHKKCKSESIQARDNVSSFSLWCMLYEVPPVLILSADDVVMGRNAASVVRY